MIMEMTTNHHQEDSHGAHHRHDLWRCSWTEHRCSGLVDKPPHILLHQTHHYSQAHHRNAIPQKCIVKDMHACWVHT